MKNRFSSINAKINLWYLVLMCVLSVGLILSIVAVAKTAQNSEIQQNLVRSVERNIDEIEVENGLLDVESDFAYRNGEIFALVYSESGEILGGEYPEGADSTIPLEAGRFGTFDGFYVYDTKVEFTKYDYKVNGETGEIISSEVEGADFFTPFEGDLDFYGDDCEISCKKAFDIAVKKSGLDLSKIEIINARSYEYNDDPIYEIEFHNSQKAYSDIWVRGVVKASGLGGVWGTLVRLAAIILPVFLIISALIGKVITNKALEPARRLSDAVSEIHSGNDLSKRIDVSDGDPTIKAVSEGFNEMMRRLEVSFESERHFTSDASHELRTPTAVILAECEYQLSRTELDEEDREGFETIHKQTVSMKQLIAQLLEMTKMQQNSLQLQKEKEDLSVLVSSLCDDCEVLNKKGITLHRDIDSNAIIEMDVLLISRLVTNLLSNAYNYGREKGNIFVSMKKEKEKIRLSVADDGIGIAKEHQEKIFNRFYRVDKARCREDGCSGLGLPMVKQIALLHNAEVFLESEEGKGSCFTIEFSI